MRVALAISTVLMIVGGCDTTRPRSDMAVCQPDRPCPGITAEQCAVGSEAELYGRSAFAEETCVAKDDAACRASELSCKAWGQCSAPSVAGNGQCAEALKRPERDADFLASRNAACGNGHTCVAKSDADCRAALVCKLEGRCSAADGVCIASSEADCAAADNCAELGWCSLEGTRCTATRYEDCQRSRACDDWSECGIAPSLSGCMQCSTKRQGSLDCINEGRCTRSVTENKCIATELGQCQASAICRTQGRCRPSNGECVR